MNPQSRSRLAKASASKRKPGRFRPFLEQLEDRAVPATFYVLNLDDSGDDSLRDAITRANTQAGDDRIEFNVTGPISLASALPSIVSVVDIDGATAPGFAGSPLVEIDYNGSAGMTFGVGSSGSSLRFLGHVDASTAAVTLNADNILLVGNFIGLQLDGNTITGNTTGVQVNSSNNTIGGTSQSRNVITGNTSDGIAINGGDGNLISGNYIGTDSTGLLDRGNTGNGITVIGAASGNTIGGMFGNVISGNGAHGVLLDGGSTLTTVSGNIIGLNADGNGALGNSSDGVQIYNSHNNIIGQTDPVIDVTFNNTDDVSEPVSAWQGIRASDTPGQYLIVGTSGNNGLLFDGTINGVGVSHFVNYPLAATTSVYGPDNLSGDLIRLVGSYKNSDFATADVTVNGFLFQGTKAQLTQAANYQTVNHTGSKYNYVHSTMGGLVVGNYDSEAAHGTFSLPLGPGHAYIYDIDGATFLTDIVYPGALSNTAYGIWHNGETSYTIVGGYSLDPVNNFENPGTPFGQAYMVDYDTATGLFTNWASFEYPNGTNYVTHFEGISSVDKGVYTLNADSLQSGSSNPAQGSWVSVSRNADGTFGAASWVDLNYPGVPSTTNITSSNAVYGNQVVGVVIGPQSGFSYQATVNLGFQLSNVISGNGGNGISLYGANDNQIAMNYIGTDSTGTLDRGNTLSGIFLTGGAQDNLIGGSASGGNDPTNGVFVRPPQGNLISGNDLHGVFLTGGATLNTLSGNFIGTDASGNAALGNTLDGVSIVSANGNSLLGCTIHTDPFVFYNVISGNGGNGIRVNNSNDTTIQANFIGMGANNNTAVGNTLDGVLVEGSSSRTLMGGPIPLGNVVAANLGNGIVVKDTASFFTSYNTFAGLAAFSDVLTFGNGLNGMLITSSGSDILIRTNVITRNGANGIEIGGNANGVRVVGNIIGLNTNGTVAMGNLGHGVLIGGSAANIVIGGPQPTFNIIPHNVISSNGVGGVAVVDNAFNTQINSSYIGTDLIGNTAFGNAEAGILVGGASNTTTIGSLDPDFLTVISANLGGGVVISGGDDVTILGSLIGVGAAGLQSLPNADEAIFVSGASTKALTIAANTIDGRNAVSTSTSAAIRLISILPATAVIDINQNFITGFANGVHTDDLASGADVTIFNNSFTDLSGLAIRNGTGTGALINASGNWWDTNTAAGVAGKVSANVDNTPWLDVGTDVTPSTPGFQGDFSTLHVDDGAQFGLVGRIQEGINLSTGSAPTIFIESGTFFENVSVAKDLSLIGSGPTSVINPSGGVGVDVLSTADTVVLQNFRVSGADSAINAINMTSLTVAGLTLTGNDSGGTLTNVVTINFQTITGDGGQTVNFFAAYFGVSGQDSVGYVGTTTLNVSTGGGDDILFAGTSATTTFNLDGGTHFLGDLLIVYTSGLPTTITPTQVLVSGRVPINYVNIENVREAEHVVDNADAEFSVTGTGWAGPVGTDAYNTTFRYAAEGVGVNVAEWSFTVAPGQYLISVTWDADAIFATNAPFTILDGTTVLGTVFINQEIVPDDVAALGFSWEYLGTFDIGSHDLRIQLSDNANGYVSADAVRIERVGDLPTVVDNADAEFSVTGMGWAGPVGTDAYNTTFRYAAEGVGANVAEWAFTVAPGVYQVSVTWDADEVFATNSPFTIFDGSTLLGMTLINQEVSPNDTTALGFSWEYLGTFQITGETLRIQLSDNANGYVSADAVRIERVGDLPNVIDNADAEFSVTGGGWSEPVGTNAYHTTFRYAAEGVGANVAEWEFTVAPGQYRVSATWVADAVFATNAPFTIRDGSTVRGTTLINQEITPDDTTALGFSWEFLGTFDIEDTLLTVQLSDLANGFVNADAIRIERMS